MRGAPVHSDGSLNVTSSTIFNNSVSLQGAASRTRA